MKRTLMHFLVILKLIKITSEALMAVCLELYRDKNDPTIFFTYSNWESEQHLENYRQSDIFKHVWAKTKPLFNRLPEAWSVDSIDRLE